MLSLRSPTSAASSVGARRRPAAAAAAAVRPQAARRAARRRICCRVSDADADKGAEPEQQERDATENVVPHTGRASPMSEDKRAATPEQGAAPEGDAAIAGQAWQPIQQDGETPEQRYGSAEEATEAAEASKDRTRKSERQTGDDQAGAFAEGSA